MYYSVCFIHVVFSINAYAIPDNYTIDSTAAIGAKVFLSFNKNEGSSATNYGYDPYGTYLPGFPSMNDNGDVAGRASYVYIDPHTGEEKIQWESAVWVKGEIHRFGVNYCSTSSCQSRAAKINNSRDIIVGSSHAAIAGTTPYFERSFQWRDNDNNWSSGYVSLDNSIQSYVEDVNDHGNTVGSAITGDNYLRHAQVVISNVRYTIGTAETRSLGVAINNNNDVVGAIVVGNSEQAFRWSIGESTSDPGILPSLAGGSSIAYDINDDQLIVGAAKNFLNHTRAVLWQGADVFDLGTLGGEKSVARSINNNGTIVGYAETENRKFHAFVHQAGEMVDLNDTVSLDNGWVIVDAFSINVHGQILVRAQKNGSLAMEDNAYWVLSHEGFVASEGPAMAEGHGYCQWGQSDCEIIYPPSPAENNIYPIPSGELPTIPLVEIPNGDAYVCNTNCESYATLIPQYNSINDAINNTVNDNTIIVLPGEYRESIRFSYRTIMGISREYTVINAEGISSRPVTLKGRANLNNLAITGGTALDGGGIQISGGDNTVDNCIVQGNTASRDGGGIHGLRYSSFTVSNSIVSQNKATYGGGFTSWGYSNATIENNRFLNNEAVYGAGAFMGSYATILFNANTVSGNFASRDGGGVYVNAYTRDRYVRNSVITNNNAARYGGGIYRGLILGSVVYGNTAGFVKYSAVYGTGAINSIIWGNAGTSATSGIYNSIIEGNTPYCFYCANVINQNPLFVDPEIGDFRLRDGSPAIDNGTNTSEVYGQYQDDDFNGIKRGIDGDGKGISAGDDYDIGAFEFSPSI